MQFPHDCYKFASHYQNERKTRPNYNKSAKGASKWSSPECQTICTSMVVRYEFVSGIRPLIWLWYLQNCW